jgi:Abnormal spindle-like microcephaly-assoc'd, ASPM-SPD-2-Hydin
LTQSYEVTFCRSLIPNFTAINESFRQISRPICREEKLRSCAGHSGTRGARFLLLAALIWLPILMTGCTSGLVGTDSSDTGPFRASPGVVTFGSVPIGQTAVSGVALINQTTSPVQVLNISVSGKSFTLSNAAETPITVAAGGTFNLSVNFSPSATGAADGELMITSNEASDKTVLVNLSGTGTAAATPALSALTCASGTITGAGTDNCTVTLTAAAQGSGQAVTLASNNPAVSVPASVMVASGATSAGFTATATAVTSPQTVALSANVDGVSDSFLLQLGAVSPGLNVSTTNLSFGNVAVNSAAAQALTLASSGTEPVTVNAATVNGSGFSVSGANFPLTLPPGQTAALNVQFAPPAAGPAAGQLTLTSDSANTPSTVVNLSGTGTVTNPSVLSGLNCASSSFTGTGTDSCTVTLSGAAGSGGATIALASNNSAVSVPGSVTIAQGSASASFIATVSAVSNAESATITASAGGNSEVAVLQLNAASAILRASVAGVAFGNVNVNTTASQQLTLTATGSLPVTISALTISGSGFSVSGLNVPATLNPNQSIGVMVQFTPTTTGSVSGTLTLASNATGGGTLAIGLSGTGSIAILPTLSSFSCASNSITGAGTDACTVALSSAAPSGGLTVNLSSSAAAVTVPAAVQIPQGSSSASFSATATSVTSAQTVTLTASMGSNSEQFALGLGAYVSTLSVSTANLAFGNVQVNSPATQSVMLTSTGTAYVTVNAATISGSGFSASGASFPLTLSPNQTAMLTVQFDPATAGPATGTLTLSSNSSTGATTTLALTGTGVQALTGLNCASSSVTGPGTDACTVTVNAASSGGYAIGLASNNAAVTVPAMVSIAAGATSASFTATVGAVNTAQTANLTASAGGATQTFAIQLAASSSSLSASTSSLAFGDVTLNNSATQTLTLSTSASSPLTVSLATVVGAGFSLAGTTFPLTISAGQPAALNVVFDPTALGSSTGTLTVVTTSLTNPAMVISLSGTGVSVTYEVNLTWTAPGSSTDPVAGYNVYRSSDGGNTYQELNTSLITQTTYVDTTVQDGQSYDYMVESADAGGVESAPSNLITEAIP